MIGQSVAHYTIVEKLGEGGMGVVYKAHDTRLDRFVALKFLPPHVAASDQDKARFMQEAKSAAALNHPNICTIHGVEESEGRYFIVMEFVEGQTLQERKSSLSQKQALDIGIQIAEGLAAAHEKGIVHRDIKPENVMVRKDGIVQIMDFGLAKLRGASRLTKEGSTVGTAGYMSPEQVQGLETDHRSDIFSLGVLLYEMFSGQIPFKGVHETAIAYEIVNVETAPLSSLKPDITPELDTVILECLEKDPKERAQSAGQVALDLKRCRRESSRQRVSRITAARPVLDRSRTAGDEPVGPLPPAARKGLWWAVAATAVVMLAAGYGSARYLSPVETAAARPVIAASISLPSALRYADGVGGHSMISPDGTRIVFVASDSLMRSVLWIRPLRSDETKMLNGTENAQYPFWSFDSRSVGFFADGKLKVVDADGGPVMSLADAPFGRGGAWSPSGEIVFSPSVVDFNLLAVSAAGGATRPVTSFDSTVGAMPRYPFMLPDGDHFLFTMLSLANNGGHSDVYVGSLKDGQTSKLIGESSYAMFASGYLFLFRQGILIAQPFDPVTLTVSGKPVTVQGNINSWTPRAKADYSVSQNGLLLYSLGGSTKANELFWVDRSGVTVPIGQFEPFTGMHLSPDGSKIVFDQVDARGERPTVWIYDVARKVRTRLSFGPNGGSSPRWSHDGRKVFFSADVNGSKANIFEKRTDGSGEEVLLVSGEDRTVAYNVMDASPDGRFLLIGVGNGAGTNLGVIDLADPARRYDVQPLGIAGTGASFSPDGKWILFQSAEAGNSRIYVASFRGVTGRWQVPSDGGSAPLWHGEMVLYYSTTNESYERCAVMFPNGTPQFGTPEPLFTGGRSQNAFLYGVETKGERFLAFRPANAGSGGDMSLIVNWQGKIGH